MQSSENEAFLKPEGGGNDADGEVHGDLTIMSGLNAMAELANFRPCRRGRV